MNSATPPFPRPAARGFTLIEVMVGVGVFAMVVLSSSAAFGAMVRLQRDAYDRAKACNLAALVGQWRCMQMASLAYSYYVTNWFTAGSPKAAMTAADWKPSSAATPWMSECSLLTTQPTWSPALAAPLTWKSTYTTIPATTMETLVAGTTPLYFVKLDGTGTDTYFPVASMSLPPGSTLGITTFRDRAEYQALRDLCVTFSAPPAPGDGSWVVMTVWSTSRDAVVGASLGSGAKVPFRFLCRFVIPDTFIP